MDYLQIPPVTKLCMSFKKVNNRGLKQFFAAHYQDRIVVYVIQKSKQ